MTVITIGDVLDGVLNRLVAAYPDADLLTEPTGQEQTPYSFVVRLSPVEQKPMQNRRYRRTHSAVVQYHPSLPETEESSQAYREMYSVAETLFDILRRIVVPGGLVPASEMSYELMENSLLFSVKYVLDIYEQAAAGVSMAELEQEVHTGNDG